MPKAIVTEQNVFDAANQLIAAGEEPSIVNVQKRIGGGSYTTVKQHLDAWHAQRQQPPLIALPPDLMSTGQAFLQTVWSAAVAHADERVTHIQDEAQQRVATAEASLAQAEAVIQQTEAQLEALIQERDGAHEQNRILQSDLAQAQSRAQVAEALVTEQTQRLAHLSETQTRLEGELGATQAKLGHAESIAQQRADDLAARTDQLSTAQQSITTLERAEAEARSAVQVAEARGVEQTHRITELKAELQAARDQTAAAIAAQGRLEGEVGSLQDQITNLLARFGGTAAEPT